VCDVDVQSVTVLFLHDFCGSDTPIIIGSDGFQTFNVVLGVPRMKFRFNAVTRNETLSDASSTEG